MATRCSSAQYLKSNYAVLEQQLGVSEIADFIQFKGSYVTRCGQSGTASCSRSTRSRRGWFTSCAGDDSFCYFFRKNKAG
jgi:hypothetical protein